MKRMKFSKRLEPFIQTQFRMNKAYRPTLEWGVCVCVEGRGMGGGILGNKKLKGIQSTIFQMVAQK